MKKPPPPVVRREVSVDKKAPGPVQKKPQVEKKVEPEKEKNGVEEGEKKEGDGEERVPTPEEEAPKSRWGSLMASATASKLSAAAAMTARKEAAAAKLAATQESIRSVFSIQNLNLVFDLELLLCPGSRRRTQLQRWQLKKKPPQQLQQLRRRRPLQN